MPTQGTIYNHSSKTLLVIADGVAFRLTSKRRSPFGVDAGAVKAEDRTSINDHDSWWRVPDFVTLHIRDDGRGTLETESSDLAWAAAEDEFGAVSYDLTDGWGQTLSD